MMEIDPLVSVIMPAYNAERTLPDALDSALRQTYERLEVVVVDDGSTDGTRQILREYADRDPRVTYRCQDHAGPASARNRGIRAARGEYVAFLDADDLWLKDKLALQMGKARRQSGSVVLTGVQRFMVETGRQVTLSSTSPPDYRSKRNYVETLLGLTNFQMAVFNTALVPRACLDEVGIFDESLPVAEDWDLWLRLAGRFPFANVDKPLLLYRKHAGSLTRTSRLGETLAVQLAIMDRVAARVDLPPFVTVAAKQRKIVEFAEGFSYNQDYAGALRVLLHNCLGTGAYRDANWYRAIARVCRDFAIRRPAPGRASSAVMKAATGSRGHLR
jgi:glycosyltransferase involved in cell wall biosynthesis